MKRNNKKIGDVQEDLILLAAVGVGVYLLINQLPNLVPDFLKGGSSADQTKIATLNTTAPNNNPWNYQYQFGLYGLAPTAYGASFWTNLHDTFLSDNNTGSGGTFNYAVDGETINNAMGVLIETDGDIDAVFNSLTNQADLANISAYLFFNYGVDLKALLQNGRGSPVTFSNGLYASHMAQLIDHVNSLPPQ